MLEFSVSNQLLSRLDATKVVADSENYLECAFQFSDDWANTAAVATFGHSKVANPISVRIVDGKCQVPHEVIKTYGFQLSVYGTAEGSRGDMCHIPTNVVTVEVEASGTGSGLTPTEPTKSMYDSLMAAITAGEKAVAEAKTSALASAEMAESARKNAAESKGLAEKAKVNATISATSCATEAQNTRDVWEMVRVMRKEIEAMTMLCRSYVLGGNEERQVALEENIAWENGVFTREWLNLDPAQRYQVWVNDTWYDVMPEWTLVEESRTTGDEQAELSGMDDEEFPETPGGEEANPGGGETTETPGGGETPENPGGEEVNPGGDETDSSGIPVVKPIKIYVKKKDIVKLVAGPVTIEDVRVDQEQNAQMICRLTTIDGTVRKVEIRTDGELNAKYCYEQALAAAQRAEAAAQSLGALQA